ncbi:MAG: adenylate/guanylate cyclase domain-containing protein [Proteobacteria bacterium]|nr:adenylate/guanylate cyclase domain-containing protein [Pseudomonadota bacterium]
MLKKIFTITGFKISVFITLFIFGVYLWNYLNIGSSSFIELMDKKVVDFIQRSRGMTLETDHIAIVAIDTKSVDYYGRWPWGRDKMAQLLHELQDHYQVKVFGYDVLFSEPDSNDVTSGKVLERFYDLVSKENPDSRYFLDRIQKIKSDVYSEVNNDAKFGAELSKWDNIVLGYFFFLSANLEQTSHLSPEQLDEFSKRIENSEITIIQGAEFLDYIPLYEGFAVEANIPGLISSKNLSGFFNVVPDWEDGTIRRVPLVIRYKDAFYPSLGLQILRRYYGDKPIRMIANQGGIEAFYIGDKRINTASDGTVMINYKGPEFTFPNYSVYDVINHNIPKEKLKDKIVILGATEVGVFDLRNTPVSAAYPGVEVHATIVENMISGDYFYRSDFVYFLTALLILVFGFVMGIILPKLSAAPGLIFSLTVLGGYIGVNSWFLVNEKAWTSYVYIVLVIVLNWFSIVIFKFFGEEKDKRFIKGAFQQYLSPKVIDQLVDDPSMLTLGGEKKDITAFFSDVQGFSTISESLTPEELVELLNEYLTAMTDIVMKYDGTVDKFEGDAVIAFFGAPIAYPDHATRACLASLEMQEKLVHMREKWREEGKHELYVRIGLNTGSCVVGNMGSAYRMDYTMMGDSVNLAARLEGVNKEYKTFCMISEFTYEEVKNTIETRELDMIRVVGKNEPVKIYEVLGRKGEVDEEKLKAIKYYSKGLELYRKQDWDEAKKYFAHTNKLLGYDGVSQVFFDRCKEFKNDPPGEAWDGVYQMQSK